MPQPGQDMKGEYMDRLKELIERWRNGDHPELHYSGEAIDYCADELEITLHQIEADEALKGLKK